MEAVVRRASLRNTMADTPNTKSLIKSLDEEFQLAFAAQNAGRLSEAEEGYHRVLNRNPNYHGAQHNLGLIMLSKGQAGAALPHFLHALKQEPDATEIHNSLGNAYTTLGNLVEAEASYRKAIKLNGNLVAPWYNLASVALSTNRLEEAETCYRRAIELNPIHRDAHLNLGNLLRDKNPELGMEITRKALAIDPNYHLAHNNLGNFLRDADRLDEAAESYRRAVEISPRFTLGWLNLGTVLNHLGQTEESLAALRRAIELDPAKGDPYFQLAVTQKLKPDDPAVAAMRRLYDNPETPDEERMFVAFALGRVCDENKLYDEAFAYWQTGNRLKNARIRFDIGVEERIVAKIKRQFTPASLRLIPPSNVTDDTPIFVVGMIRSGTTLMEHILASHPQVVGADENTWFPDVAATLKNYHPCELTRVGEAYIKKLRERFGPGPQFIVDKLVGNWLHVGLIHLALPNAKIICMRRNPYDSCLSAYSSLFVSFHEYCYDMQNVAKFYSLFRDLMDHWNAVLPGKVLEQRYEGIIEDPENSVRKVLEFCNLPFDEGCLNFHRTERRVKTASTQQVREKLHSRSVGRWRNYEKHLAPWRPILGDPS